ncbi:glycosyltransferase [Butyrivibrio sp. AE3006]|uniref:glycosyltransferase n=1 Tax=Butyrivibrio sp. AE3006 TaxID=1280673 RepID=UPI0003F90106|nr:glycosyltransferase [Butyrivibrio sp. AE3006]
MKDYSKKKVVLISNTLTKGGAERVVSNLSLYLSEEYDCDILLNDDTVIDYPYKGQILTLGLPAVKDKRNLFYQAYAFARRIQKLRQLKKTGEYAATLSFSDSANVANILSGNRYSMTILSVHTNITKQGRDVRYKYIVAPLIRFLYNKADKIIAVSKGVAADLTDNYGIDKQKIKVIYNGCDRDQIRRKVAEPLTEKEEKWLEGDNIIVAMGRLDPSKGHWHLIRSLSLLKSRGINFKLLILGEGDLRGYLEKLIKELELTDNVILGGFCDNPFKILAKADVYVMPSMYEGFPNSIIEAMCCGLPCIASDFESGAREILAPNTDNGYKNKADIEHADYGLIVPVCCGTYFNAKAEITKEENILAEAIETMLCDDELKQKYAEKSRKRAADITIEHMAQEWLECVE